MIFLICGCNTKKLSDIENNVNPSLTKREKKKICLMEISCVTYELASIRENYEIAKEKRKQNY